MKYLWIILFIALITPVFGETIPLGEEESRLSLNRRMDIAQDPEGLLNPDNMASSEWDEIFTRNEEATIQGQGTFWIRFSLENNTPNPMLRLLEYNYFRSFIRMEVYSIASDGQKRLQTDTPGRSFSPGELKYRNPLFRLEIAPNSGNHIYIKLETKAPVILDFNLHTLESFLPQTRSDQLFWGAFLGILLIMSLYNLFLYFSFKDLSYLYLSLFSISLVIMQGAAFGTISEHLPFLQPYDRVIFSLFVTAGTAFFILFGGSLMDLKNIFPKVNKILNPMILLLPASALISIFIPVLIILRNGLIFVEGVFLIILAMGAVRKGSKKARYFLGITAVLVFSALLNIFHFYIPLLHSIMNKLPDMVLTGCIALIVLFSFYLTGSIQKLQLEKAAEQARAIQGLEKVNRLKDEFLANTSHELRTPLHGIIGLTESLLQNPALPEAAHSSLSLIASSGKRLSHLINDILDFSRIKNSDLKLNHRSLSLAPLIDQVIRFTSFLTQGKDLKIRQHLPASLPPVWGDEDRILQILYNLAGNAVKFTQQGTVVIRAESLEQSVMITVEDTGIGIPGEKLKEIFLPFHQVDTGISRRFPGTGLGLAITKHLIELHGGELEVASTKDKGSRFYFTLPQSSQPAEKAAEAPFPIDLAPILEPDIEKTAEKGKQNILIVDDDPVNIRVLQELLEQAQFSVHAVRTGEAALQLLDRHREIDMVLLDVMMPLISGYEVCRRIRQNHSLYEKPVLMLTARQQEEDLRMGFDSGANDYLTKPFNRMELLARVGSLVSLRKKTRENHVLESSNSLKSSLLHMASHGLKNPLAVIRGNISLLSKELTDTAQQGLISPIRRAADKMVTLINEFLENAMIEEGKLILNREPLHMSRLLKIAAGSLESRAMAKKQKLEISSGKSAWIEADEHYFLEILDNLIGNAIKYSPPGKSIRIGYDSCLKDNTPYVVISVKDQGPGLTKEDTEKLFTPFARLSAKPTGGEISTGMGLAITKQLVELHKGEISALSTPGKGSEFTVKIPAAVIPE